MREKDIGRRKGEMEWGKISLIKEASKRLFSGGKKRRGERKTGSLLSSHLTKGRNKMYTHFGMKIYLITQESGGEGDKQGWGGNGREGKWEERVIRNKHSWGGTRSKERIEEMGGRIGWSEM